MSAHIWKEVAVALIVLALLVQIPAVSSGEDLRSGTKAQLVLRVALQDDIKTLNPLSAFDVWTWDVIRWMFDGLTWRNSSDNDHIEPWAAEWFHHGPRNTWDTSLNYSDGDGNDDYRNWTVKLRDGIKWHDWNQQTGDDRYVRAHDVIFSLRLMADIPGYSHALNCLVARNPDGSMIYGRDLPANGTIRLITWDGENVAELPYWIDLSEQRAYPDLPVVYVTKESDDLTLHYNLTYAYVDFTEDTLMMSTFPERIWKDHISDRLTWDDPQCLISFGQFKFGYWNHTAQNGRINTFRDFFRPEYECRGRQKPYIDSIVFKVYANTDAAIMALTSDEVDYIAWAIDPGFIDTIVNDPDLMLVRNADLGFFYIAFNMRIPDFGYAGYREEGGYNPTYTGNYTDVGKPFRVAMAHLIDKQRIVTKFLQGFATIGTSVVSPVNSYWYNPEVKIYAYDPDEAKRILDDYAPDSDGDGIRELPNLGEDKITMLAPPADYDPIRAQSGLTIQAAAKAAGLNFESRPTNFGKIVNQINQHSFQMYMLGWSIPSPLSSARAPCDFFSSYNDVFGEGQNYPGYHNKSFDRLCCDFEREPDMEKRRNISYELQNAIAEDVPYSVLYYRDILETYNVKFTGWVPRYGTIFNKYSLRELRLTPPPPNEITISVPYRVEGGTPVNLDAYVYNPSTNEPVSGVIVTFSVSSGNLSSSTAITDSSGKAEVLFTPPVDENRETRTVTVEASYYDENSDVTVREVKVITVIPPPRPPVELGMEIRPGYSFTIEENTTLPIEVKVLDRISWEYYEKYNSSTGEGVTLDCSAFPDNADIGMYYDNGTWYVNFTGHALLNTTVYDIRVDAVLYENYSAYATASTNISAVVLKAPLRQYGEHTSEIPEGYLFAGAGLLAVAAVAVFLIFRKRHGKHF